MPPGTRPTESPPLDLLLRERGRFLAFLRRRVPDTAVAEDILQTAYLRAVERGRTLRDRDSAVAWFYRVLRRAWVDEHRRQGVRDRAVARRGQAGPSLAEEPLLRAVCACVEGLLPTLKPEYGEMLRRVDLGGEEIPATAAALGLTPNNAAVRLHRARRALRERLEAVCGTCTTHKCLDCQCKPARRREAGGGGRPLERRPKGTV